MYIFIPMSRFIYLVLLKCTGRTCNAHPVIGGDVVASSWYVNIFVDNLFQYVCPLIFLKVYFSSLFVNIHENHPKSVLFDLLLPRGSSCFYLSGDGKGGGGPFWDHVYNWKNKNMNFI